MKHDRQGVRRRGFVALAAGVLLGVINPARAQSDFFNLSITQAMETSQLSNSLFQMRMAAGAGSGGKSHRRNGARRPAKKSSSGPTRNRKTTFKPITTDLMPAVFAKAVGDAAKKLYRPGGGTDQLYFKPDKLDFMRWLFNYDDKMRARDGGVYRDDVAYAAGEMLIEFQLRTTNRALTSKQTQGLRRQMWRYFENNGEFQKLSNEKKQRLYETYVLLGQYMRWCYDETRGGKNKPISDAVRGAAKNQLQRFLGAPMSHIAFTDDGVARR